MSFSHSLDHTDAFLHVDTQWRLTYLNQKAVEMIQRTRQELLGWYLWDIIPSFLGTPVEPLLREAMEKRQDAHIDAWGVLQPCWLEIHAYPSPDGLSIYCQDITARKQVEEDLRESERRFHGLLESNIIGIIVSDLKGTIYEANDAFLTLLGYNGTDLAEGRMNWVAMTPPEDYPRSRQAFQELLDTGCFQPFEKEYLTKEGKRIPVLIGGTFFRREGPSPLLLAFVLDKTARKESEKQKDLFLGMTSHELKTPLAALRGTLQLVQRRLQRVLPTTESSPPEISAFFQSLAKSLADSIRQIDVQAHLINDLLDVSRITANTLELLQQRWDLNQMVRDTVEDLRVADPERTLLLAVPAYPVVHVFADRNRIGQVLTNYVANALRYSDPAQPITIGLTPQGNKVRVWVRDRGPGLREEDQKAIWQRYHQATREPGQKGSEKGLGLGLYICQTLITQHEGEVGVESHLGDGSTFWFTLPTVA